MFETLAREAAAACVKRMMTQGSKKAAPFGNAEGANARNIKQIPMTALPVIKLLLAPRQETRAADGTVATRSPNP